MTCIDSDLPNLIPNLSFVNCHKMFAKLLFISSKVVMSECKPVSAVLGWEFDHINVLNKLKGFDKLDSNNSV